MGYITGGFNPQHFVANKSSLRLRTSCGYSVGCVGWLSRYSSMFYSCPHVQPLHLCFLQIHGLASVNLLQISQSGSARSQLPRHGFDVVTCDRATWSVPFLGFSRLKSDSWLSVALINVADMTARGRCLGRAGSIAS